MLITRGMLNNIKRLDVSQDSELTKERVIALWQDLTKEQKEKIESYDISKATISRIKTYGNISVKVAAALALVTGVDPYYLTAEEDEYDNSADEDRIRQFLISHGYERILEIADVTENRKPESKPVTEEAEEEEEEEEKEEEEFEEEPIIVEEFIFTEPAAKPAVQEVMSIQEFADIQMSNLTEAQKKSIYEMPDEDFSHLLKTLELQAKYTSKAKNLLGLIRLIIIR